MEDSEFKNSVVRATAQRRRRLTQELVTFSAQARADGAHGGSRYVLLRVEMMTTAFLEICDAAGERALNLAGRDRWRFLAAYGNVLHQLADELLQEFDKGGDVGDKWFDTQRERLKEALNDTARGSTEDFSMGANLKSQSHSSPVNVNVEKGMATVISGSPGSSIHYSNVAQQFGVDPGPLLDEIARLRLLLADVDAPKDDKDDVRVAIEVIERELQEERPDQSRLKRLWVWLADFAKRVGVEVATDAVKRALSG